MEEIPKEVNGKYLIGRYPNFALYINPETRIRECFTYWELRPKREMAEVHTAWFSFKKDKGKKKERKKI